MNTEQCNCRCCWRHESPDENKAKEQAREEERLVKLRTFMQKPSVFEQAANTPNPRYHVRWKDGLGQEDESPVNFASEYAACDYARNLVRHGVVSFAEAFGVYGAFGTDPAAPVEAE